MPGFRTTKTFLAGLLAMTSTLCALDFTPEFIETPLEAGIKNREVVLKDGSARVVYCPPAGWQPEAGEGYLRFHPPGATFADLTIEAEKVPTRRAVEAADVERCRAWLKSSVPSESLEVAMEADETNSGSVANCPTIGMTVVYTSGGVRYRKRVIFVFTPDLEIHFTTVARLADFNRLYPAVRGSLFSWRWERAK